MRTGGVARCRPAPSGSGFTHPMLSPCHLADPTWVGVTGEGAGAACARPSAPFFVRSISLSPLGALLACCHVPEAFFLIPSPRSDTPAGELAGRRAPEMRTRENGTGGVTRTPLSFSHPAPARLALLVSSLLLLLPLATKTRSRRTTASKPTLTPSLPARTRASISTLTRTSPSRRRATRCRMRSRRSRTST